MKIKAPSAFFVNAMLRERKSTVWLFRGIMQWAPHEEVWGHQADKLAASQERSPPRH